MKIIFVVLAATIILLAAGLVVNSRLPQGFDLPITQERLDNNSDLPKLGTMPEFVGISSWLNSGALSKTDLKGKVVLVDFWTYSCINCIRTLPYVTGWYEKYKDDNFVVVGVHTPEFAFEKDTTNVKEALVRHHINYPVAQDNDYKTWQAYNNRYWPAHYLFDAEGNLRYTHFGEGEYDTTERNIQLLLTEAVNQVSGTVSSGQGGPNFAKINTPETYLGYKRSTLLGSPERISSDQSKIYSTPEDISLNKYYLAGEWRVESERAVAVDGAIITYRYSASAVNLVMSSGQNEFALVRVSLDGGVVPENMRGTDLYEQDGSTWVKVDSERLYSLIDAGSEYGEHVLIIEMVNSGTEAYAFTFG